MRRLILPALVLLLAAAASPQVRPRAVGADVRLIRTTALGDSVWIVATIAWPTNQIEDSTEVLFIWGGDTTMSARHSTIGNPVGTTRDSARVFLDGFERGYSIIVTATAWRNGRAGGRRATLDYTTQPSPAPLAPTLTVELRPPAG